MLELDCKHINTYECAKLVNARENKKIECKFICSKELEACGHTCQKMCKDDCTFIYPKDLKNGYITSCKERVSKTLPCGHDEEVDCGLPPDKHY